MASESEGLSSHLTPLLTSCMALGKPPPSLDSPASCKIRELDKLYVMFNSFSNFLRHVTPFNNETDELVF